MIVEVDPTVPVCLDYNKAGFRDPQLHRSLKDRL